MAGGVPVLAWLAAYLTLVHSRRQAAKVLAVLAVIPAAARLVVDVATVLWAPPSGAAETWPTLIEPERSCSPSRSSWRW